MGRKLEEVSAVLLSRAGPREMNFSARCAALHREPTNTPHPGTASAWASGPGQGRCLAVAHKEHGKANARSREGSRQAHLGAECGGCRAPPQQSLSNRNPPTHLGVVGVYSRSGMQPQKSRRLDHVVYTGNERRTCDDCIVVRQAAVVNETTVYCKYIELRGGIYCYARLKYSNANGAKTVWRCHKI